MMVIMSNNNNIAYITLLVILKIVSITVNNESARKQQKYAFLVPVKDSLQFRPPFLARASPILTSFFVYTSIRRINIDSQGKSNDLKESG